MKKIGTVPPSQYSPRALMFQFTGIQGSNEELKKWYDANRKRLRFDAGLKRFVVGKGEALRVDPQ